MPQMKSLDSNRTVPPVAFQKPGFMILIFGILAPSCGLWACSLACNLFLAPTHHTHKFTSLQAALILIATICLLIAVFSAIAIHRYRTVWLLFPHEVWRLEPSLTEVVSVQSEEIGDGVEFHFKVVPGRRMAKLDFLWKRQGRQDRLLVRSSKVPPFLDGKPERKAPCS